MKKEVKAYVREISRDSSDLLVHMPMVFSIAKKYSKLSGLDIRDLCTEGYLGLVEAKKRYEDSKKCKFISYAVWWVRQKMLAHMVNQMPGYSRPPHFFAQLKALNNGQNMTERLRARTHALSKSVISTDTEVGDRMRVQDTLPCTDDSPGDIAQQENIEASIASALGGLKPRHKWVVVNCFGLNGNAPLSAAQMGSLLGITKQAVLKIMACALKRLKHDVRMKELCKI